MIKKISGFIFATLICLANLGCICISPIEEAFYCEDISYFETGSSPTYTTEYIYYDNYTMTDVHLDLLCPKYENTTQINSCAPMAAAMAITYYDITLPNLIPNYEPGWEWNGRYYYDGLNSTFISLKETLYDLMGTNSVKPGTSESQFKNGMKSYVNQQGYNISYNSCGSNFNLNTAISYLQAQQPIIMFLSGYKYYDVGGISIGDTEMSMLCKTSPNGHVLVAYGYRKYDFYQNGAVYRTENYMIVSFGDGTTGYLPVNTISNIDAAYGIKIY